MVFKLRNNKHETKELLEKTDIESGDGYIKYPDGTLEQWGHAQIADNVAFGRVTFNIPYASNVSMTCTAGYFHETTVDIVIGLATTYADVYLTGKTYGISKERSFYWYAIGRWK